MGGLFGGVVGGLLDFGVGLFGGGPKGGASDPIHTYVTNQIKADDIVHAFLTITQAAQQRMAGRGMDALNGMIAAQGAVGIGL